MKTVKVFSGVQFNNHTGLALLEAIKGHRIIVERHGIPVAELRKLTEKEVERFSEKRTGNVVVPEAKQE